jgi:hypothetical protein
VKRTANAGLCVMTVLGSLLTAAGAVPAFGQTGREALIAGSDAADIFDYSTAARLLSRGLDPAAGSRDSTWVVGVHKLTESLLELREDSLAAIWGRWAARLEPEMQVNDVDFTTSVVSVLERARGFVEATPRDVLVVEIDFEWAAAAGEARRGRLRLEEAEVPISGMIEHPRQYLTPGQGVAIEPGSYTMAVTAAGVLPTRFTSEVLPGVTTAVRLSLLPEDAGYLYVTSRPWAVVYVDGKRIGYTTIASRRIAPGEHVFRVAREGLVPVDSTLSVAPNERVRIGPILLQPQGR